MGWASAAIERLRRGETVTIRPRGHSMTGRLGDSDTVTVEPALTQARAEGKFPDVPRDYLNLYREPTPGEWRANISRLHGIDGTNPEHLARAELEGRRQVMGLIEFMRERCPGLEGIRLLEIATQIGIRETRHIVGEYVLSGDDVRAGARFPDAIARCGYPIDVHDPAGGHRVHLEGWRGVAITRSHEVIPKRG